LSANIRIQRNIAFLAIILFIIKIIAWWWTKSVAIFTDALESTINVTAGLIGWYSLWLAAKPRDKNHPYGHGKAEYISSAIEGTMILIAGVIIIIEAARNWQHVIRPNRLDAGLLLIAATALINFIAGRMAVRQGRLRHSVALIASGKHLQSDTYSTAGVIIGLLLIRFTNWLWLDAVVAVIFALILLITGYKVLRRSLAGIMDEADLSLLEELIAHLNRNRPDQWIDLHNLRMIQYGSILHLDGHLTLPWYYNVREAHHEIEALDKMVRTKYSNQIELFVHVDDCMDFSCKICALSECPVRQHPMQQRLIWTPENVLQNKKHTIENRGGADGRL